MRRVEWGTQLPAATRHCTADALLHTMIIFKPSPATHFRRRDRMRTAIAPPWMYNRRQNLPLFLHFLRISIVPALALSSRVHNGERAARRSRPSRRAKNLMAGAESARPAPPVLPWTVRLQVLALGAFCDLSQRRDGTLNRSLFSLADRQTPARPRPDALGVRSADVVVDADRNLWARVFSPSAGEAEPAPLPVLVHFHGGGFALLSAASAPLDAMCRRFCRGLGAVVVSVNYRRAPEHRYPAAYDDCADVLSYLGTTGLPADIGVPVDLSRCFLFGDSAGGNIAHHVAHRWTSSAAASSNGPVRLAGIILLQPYFGGEERTEAELRLEGVGPVVNMRRSDWSWKAFLPEGSDRNHPAAHVTGEACPEPELPEAFPPAMVVVGGFDPLQDWQRRYAAMLQRKEKAVRVLEFPDAIHGFYMFPKLPDAGKLVKDVKNFMETDTSGH